MPIPGDEMRRSGEQLRLLAGLLSMPDQDAREIIQGLAEQHPWLAEAAEELGSTPLEQWQGEYTRLFISGFPKTACPPYESAYRSGTMQGPTVAKLERLYAQLGMRSSEMPTDYLGVMLECAALLEDGQQRPELRQRLWDEHLSRWLADFANDLSQQSELALYRALGLQLLGLSADRAGHE